LSLANAAKIGSANDPIRATETPSGIRGRKVAPWTPFGWWASRAAQSWMKDALSTMRGAYQIAGINCKAWASRPNIVTLAETAARSIELR